MALSEREFLKLMGMAVAEESPEVPPCEPIEEGYLYLGPAQLPPYERGQILKPIKIEACLQYIRLSNESQLTKISEWEDPPRYAVYPDTSTIDIRFKIEFDKFICVLRGAGYDTWAKCSMKFIDPSTGIKYEFPYATITSTELVVNEFDAMMVNFMPYNLGEHHNVRVKES